MGLDVYLHAETPFERVPTSGIWIRDRGSNREITREEWDRRFPGREPVTAIPDTDMTTVLFHRHITHNVSPIAKAAGLYDCLWSPEEHEIFHAHELEPHLRVGLYLLWKDPERFEVLNPANGWGDYEGLVEFVTAYLRACVRYPEGKIEVSR